MPTPPFFPPPTRPATGDTLIIRIGFQDLASGACYVSFLDFAPDAPIPSPFPQGIFQTFCLSHWGDPFIAVMPSSWQAGFAGFFWRSSGTWYCGDSYAGLSVGGLEPDFVPSGFCALIQKFPSARPAWRGRFWIPAVPKDWIDGRGFLTGFAAAEYAGLAGRLFAPVMELGVNFYPVIPARKDDIFWYMDQWFICPKPYIFRRRNQFHRYQTFFEQLGNNPP